MCPDARRSMEWLYWLRSTHRGEASQMLSRLDGSGFGPERVLACASARGVSIQQAITLVVEVPRLIAQLNASPLGSAVLAQVRSAARKHAQQLLRPLHPGESAVLPQGVLRAPPVRPAHFDVTQVPKDKLVLALRVTETNSNPVSGPAFERPADPMFAVWFKTFEALGTRTLTMAEMQSLIRCDINWPNRANGVRASDDFPAIKASTRGILAPHEFHLFAGGLRGQPGRVTITAGQGGEFGLFARATLPAKVGVDPAQWGSEAAIRQFWGADVKARQSDQPAQVSAWLAEEHALIQATPSQVKAALGNYAEQGLFADPREQRAVRPATEALLSSAAGSPERAAAARALTAHFRERERLLDTVSVSSATAEIQMLQTLHSHLARHGIVVQNATHQIDVVVLYGEYRELLAQGKLTTRSTVEGWLKAWDVPHVP